MQKREVAMRVFAGEFNDSDLVFKESEEQYAPQYLLTPTGAKCNRLLVIGTLLEKENIGNDSAEFWRARVVDPTGAFTIHAGQYQPEAAQMLAKIEPPGFVAVVGKPSVYNTESGETLKSIRPETIHVVDECTRNIWVFDTAKQTMERITNSKSNESGRAREHYNREAEQYKQMVQGALQSLKK